MVTRLTNTIYDLDMSLAMSLDRSHDKAIRCVETHLWIAEEGWAEDIILSVGERDASGIFWRAAIQNRIGKAYVSLSNKTGWIVRAVYALWTFWMRRIDKRFSLGSR